MKDEVYRASFTPAELHFLAGKNHLPDIVKTAIEAYQNSASRYELTLLPLAAVRLVIWESTFFSWQEEPVDSILDALTVEVSPVEIEKFFKLRSEQVTAEKAELFAGSNI